MIVTELDDLFGIESNIVPNGWNADWLFLRNREQGAYEQLLSYALA